jgi:hypothetical protein
VALLAAQSHQALPNGRPTGLRTGKETLVKTPSQDGLVIAYPRIVPQAGEAGIGCLLACIGVGSRFSEGDDAAGGEVGADLGADVILESHQEKRGNVVRDVLSVRWIRDG